MTFAAHFLPCWGGLRPLPPPSPPPSASGCDSGFGKATARHLDRLGFRVFATVLDAGGEGAGELRRNCSPRLALLQLDITRPRQVRRAYAQVRARLGPQGRLRPLARPRSSKWPFRKVSDDLTRGAAVVTTSRRFGIWPGSRAKPKRRSSRDGGGFDGAAQTSPFRRRRYEVCVCVCVSGLWALVNNAGVCVNFGDIELSRMSNFRGCMEVNFFGTLHVTKTFLPLLRRDKGRLVTVSSPAGTRQVSGFHLRGGGRESLD